MQWPIEQMERMLGGLAQHSDVQVLNRLTRSCGGESQLAQGCLDCNLSQKKLRLAQEHFPRFPKLRPPACSAVRAIPPITSAEFSLPRRYIFSCPVEKNAFGVEELSSKGVLPSSGPLCVRQSAFRLSRPNRLTAAPSWPGHCLHGKGLASAPPQCTESHTVWLHTARTK
jgi:hypothetical protein